MPFTKCYTIPTLSFGFPNVNKTPAPPLPFIPLPYPNISLGTMALPPTTAMNVLNNFTPAHTLATTEMLTNGGQPGVLGGLVSQIIMGPSRNMFGSVKTFMGAMPVTRMGDPTMQNLINCPGVTCTPAQVTNLVLT